MNWKQHCISQMLNTLDLYALMVTFNYSIVLDHFYKSAEALQWSALWCF